MKHALLVVVCLFVRALPAWGQDVFPFAGMSTGEGVNIRSGQSVNYEALGELHNGQTVVVVDKKYSWYKIRLPEQARSYVAKEYLEQLGGDVGMVTGTRLNIRARPSVQSSVIGQLDKGTLVRIAGTSGDWIQIVPTGDLFGWVAEDFIAFHAPDVPPPRVVEPPTRNIYKRKRMAAAKVAEVKPAPTPTPPPPPPPEPSVERVMAQGVIDALGSRSLTEDIRHQLLVDGKPAYYLKSYRAVMDGFTNFKVKIEGDVIEDITAPHPVVLVTKIYLIL